MNEQGKGMAKAERQREVNVVHASVVCVRNLLTNKLLELSRRVI